MIKRKHIKYEDKHKELNGIVYKWCPDCNEWYLMSDDNFKVHPSKKDGFSDRCKVCQEKYNHNHYMKNHDENKANARLYKRANKEKCNKVDREYRELHKDERKIKEKEWRLEHKQHLRKYLQNYLKLHPEKTMYYNKERQHRNHVMYDEEWENCKRKFNYRCAYCGLPIEEHFVYRRGKYQWQDFCKEHVIDEGKNDLSNCIPSCNTCNVNKNTKGFHDFYNPNNPDFTYERHHEIYLWMRYEYKKYILPKRRFKGQHLKVRLKEIEELKNKTKRF
jgi:hypothetical protein